VVVDACGSFRRYANALFISHQRCAGIAYALPALPTWIISPVGLSSLLKTGQLVPSALTSVNSSFVPSILNLLSSGLMLANSGNSFLKRLLSVVFRSRLTSVGWKSMTAVALSIFFRYNEATTDTAVW
jgi:hypothetical protein